MAWPTQTQLSKLETAELIQTGGKSWID